ncbi:MAG TPA: cyclic nucleotide-binding domain-containing protein [Spirochaetota bacterium]|nr:cyclic nucleotide-binding domain-containing protein [Spirochaetota bacterium]HOD13172.1 cyclic nucleotide-binding domain-containing protein [Spirochaetota bacterium]HPG49021.1 cyclic nucleotide-binding domain-containing protein [Spirochaetota bacterium]HPN12348.1 cyclic nucleotide-binding domain-containing protein [Spirochaetota bacterium]
MKEQSRNAFKAGAYIYIEGDEDVDAVYIVEKGLVEFKSTNERISTHGNNAAPGDVFGFISSLSRRPRMETAFAKVNSTVLIFTRERFLALLQKNSNIAIKLLNSYADELRMFDTMIVQMGAQKDLFLTEDEQLFNLGSYYHRSGNNAAAFYVLTRYSEMFATGAHAREVRDLLAAIQKTGITRIPEPVPEGIYKRYADKQIVFCEHEPGDELYIIKKGKVKIVKYHNNSEIILSVLKEGEIFGELAIVSDKPRNATAISFGTTIVLPINKDSMIKLIKKSSDLLKRIFTAISQRVWFTFIRMESKFYEKPITRVYVFLENKLIEDNVSLKNREPHLFSFGIDELLKMATIPPDKIASVTDELTRDHNLTFNLGRTVIENPSLVASRARYHRSRDHLYDGEDDERYAAPARTAPVEFEEPELEVLENTADVKIPEPVSAIEDQAGSSSNLFDELDDALDKA